MEDEATKCEDERHDDDALPTGAEVVELLSGIPGVTERIDRARDEIERGEGIPLRDLDPDMP